MKTTEKMLEKNSSLALPTPKNDEKKGMIKREILVRDIVVWKPKAIIFCCGIGMTSEGLKQAGYDIIGVIDIWNYSEETYKANFPNVKFLRMSLREISAEMICEYFDIRPGELSMIQISNPCTVVSRLTQSSPYDETNDLFYVATTLAFNIHDLVGCSVVCYENVESLTDNSVFFGMVISYIKKYAPEHSVGARIINGYVQGDPQSRDRIFIEAVLKSLGQPVWAEAVPQDQRKHICDIIPEAKYVTSTNFGNRTYYPDEPLPTLTAHPNIKIYLGDDNYRKLEGIEGAQFMGLSKTFKLTGSDTNQLKGAGNGVCVSVMRRLGECIKNKLLKIKSPEELLAIETTSNEPIVDVLETDAEIIDVVDINEVDSSEPTPEITYTPIIKKGSSKIISANELLAMEFESLPLEGNWLDFLGKPSNDFHVVVFGLPGSGKSTFSVQLLSYLSESFGKALYVSGEEGFSMTFKSKFKSVFTDNIDVADLRNYEDMCKEINPEEYRFLVIDSLDTMKIDPVQLRAIKKRYKGAGIITISQSTKDGKQRGSNEIAHDGDITIRVEKGIATTIKNRFKEDQMTYDVFSSNEVEN
tara:strand:+ start:12732 stop:14486 length:1755 start_codon:yes stop_codon:yes gene_type:complete